MRQGYLTIGMSMGLLALPVGSWALAAKSPAFSFTIPFLMEKPAVERPQARGVRIAIMMPAVASKEVQEKLSPTDELIRLLLGPEAKKEVSLLENGRGRLFYYSSLDWNRAYASVWLQKARKELIDLWGDQIIIDSPDFQIRPGLHLEDGSRKRSREHELVRSAERIYGFLGARVLASGGYERLYDGARAGGGAFVDETLSAHLRADRLGAGFPDVAAYASLIERASDVYGVDPALIAAVMSVRSGFDAKKRAGNCYGLMGVSDHAAKAHGLSVTDLDHPAENIFLGTRLLAGYLRQFDGDVGRALGAYALGPAALKKNSNALSHRDARALILEYRKVSQGGGIRVELPLAPAKKIVTGARMPARERVLGLSHAAGAHSRIMVFERQISQAAQKFSVDGKLLEAMLMQENPWGDPSRKSNKGAMGLGQLMPKTAKLLGITDRSDPAQNLTGMARHMKYLLEKFKGNRFLAVAAYNCGEVPVIRARYRVPRIEETRNYVRRVFTYYEALTGEFADPTPWMVPARAKKSPRRRK